MNEELKELVSWIKQYETRCEYTIENGRFVCDRLELQNKKISELPNSIGDLSLILY